MRIKTRNGIIAGAAIIGCLLAGAASADPGKGGFKECSIKRLLCSIDLKTCDGDLLTCDENLATCDGDLLTCDEDLATCDDHLDQCLESNVVSPGDGAGNGAPLKYEECADGLTVADLNTGLLWERKVEGNALCTDFLHRTNSSCTWGQATGVWIDDVNIEVYAGFDDWRLPNVRELQSIVDYGERAPAIDPTFPGETFKNAYWSATSDTVGTSDAWFVNFNSGIMFTFYKGAFAQVRAVRTGSCL